MYSHLCHYRHVALCYWYTLPKSVMFLISLLLNSSRFGSLMLLRRYFPPFLHFPRGGSYVKCVSVGVFTNSSQETGVRLFPHGINLLWGSPLLVSLLLFFFPSCLSSGNLCRICCKSLQLELSQCLFQQEELFKEGTL